MNTKGFTLIELLGVIMLLGIVTAIAVPSIGAITDSIKKNMLDKKVEIIEKAANLFGEDIKGSVIYSNKHYKEYPCKSYIISDLVPDYLDKDNDNNCITCLSKDENNNCTSWSTSDNIGCIVDPSNQDKYLDKLEIIIYYKNKRIATKVDTEGNLTCS